MYVIALSSCKPANESMNHQVEHMKSIKTKRKKKQMTQLCEKNLKYCATHNQIKWQAASATQRNSATQLAAAVVTSYAMQKLQQ